MIEIHTLEDRIENLILILLLGGESLPHKFTIRNGPALAHQLLNKGVDVAIRHPAAQPLLELIAAELAVAIRVHLCEESV